MSEQRIVLSEGDVFLSPEDRRSENWRLAMRLFLRELKTLKMESVDKIFKRWNVNEIELGDSIRLGIDFPSDLERYQWFKTEGYELRKMHGINNNAKAKKS
jgi:hypothetical protein